MRTLTPCLSFSGLVPFQASGTWLLPWARDRPDVPTQIPRISIRDVQLPFWSGLRKNSWKMSLCTRVRKRNIFKSIILTYVVRVVHSLMECKHAWCAWKTGFKEYRPWNLKQIFYCSYTWYVGLSLVIAHNFIESIGERNSFLLKVLTNFQKIVQDSL